MPIIDKFDLPSKKNKLLYSLTPMCHSMDLFLSGGHFSSADLESNIGIELVLMLIMMPKS